VCPRAHATTTWPKPDVGMARKFMHKKIINNTLIICESTPYIHALARKILCEAEIADPAALSSSFLHIDFDTLAFGWKS